LSCWLSCCCYCPLSRVVVVHTATNATAEPPTHSGRHHRRGHLHCCCHHNCIHCSYHCRPHLTAAFTAVFDVVIAPNPASTMQIPSTLAVAINAATAVVAAGTLHLLQPSLLPSPLPPLSPLPQPPLMSLPALIWHRLMLGLAVTTARQGTTPWSLRHGREVWRYLRRGLNHVECVGQSDRY
jgi:hypothetical protein